MRHPLAIGLGVLLAWAPAAAQAPAIDATRVRDLLVLIAAPDDRGAAEAAAELQRMGPGAAPALVGTLKGDAACHVQWVASGALHAWQLEAALVEATLVELARGACRATSMADGQVPQAAALAIVDRPGGIAVLAELLREGDPPARRRAAAAFDELMKRLQPQHPRAIEATPAILAAAEAALRPLRDLAVSDAPAQARCLAFEAIDQARRLPHPAVRARASSLLDDLRVDCWAPGTPGSEVFTTRMRRESWQAIILRLDTQPPGMAEQTSAALLAGPAEDVVPPLRERLRHTDTCRGLALIAGILASRNAPGADVEAAFVRVLAGKCDGRAPFDLTLAQNVATAFAGRSDGVTRLAGLLGDRDVVVRRRVAAALAMLFERLGMGANAQPTSDAAMLAAARGAIPALLTAATTERDQQARCHAVLALQRAQEAQNDAIRAEAEALTRGRTLRCQARPNP
jgi:hypothetical protein